MKPHPAPERPGHYWAKLVHPSRMPEGEAWHSVNWEVVEVCINDPCGNVGEAKYFSVLVPGIEPCQWVADFVWGPPVAPLAEPSPLAGEVAAPGETLSAAARDVLAERLRQIEAEGYTTAHDDTHDKGELAGAAAAYAAYRSQVSPEVIMGETIIEMIWPWAPEDWKPKTRREDLVRAAALLIAEIERYDRVYGDDASICFICGEPLKEGDPYFWDVSGSFVHAACCGPEVESYVDADENPLKPGDPIPEPSIWHEADFAPRAAVPKEEA